MHSAIRLKPKTVISHLSVPKISVKYGSKESDNLDNPEILKQLGHPFTYNYEHASQKHPKNIDLQGKSSQKFHKKSNSSIRPDNKDLQDAMFEGVDSEDNFSNLEAVEAQNGLYHDINIKVPDIAKEMPEGISVTASKAYRNLEHSDKVEILSELLTSVRRASQINNMAGTGGRYPASLTFTNTLHAMVSKIKVYDFTPITEEKILPTGGGPTTSKNSDYADLAHEPQNQANLDLPATWLPSNFVADRHQGPFSRGGQPVFEPEEHPEARPSKLTDLKSKATNLPQFENLKSKTLKNIPGPRTSIELPPSPPAPLSDCLFISNRPRKVEEVQQQNASIQKNYNKRKNAFVSSKTGFKMTLSQKIAKQKELAFLEQQKKGLGIGNGANQVNFEKSSTNLTSSTKTEIRPTRKNSVPPKINQMQSFNLDQNLPKLAKTENYREMVGDTNKQMLKSQPTRAKSKEKIMPKTIGKRGKIPEILQKILTSFAYVAALVGPDGKIINVGPDDTEVPEGAHYAKLGVGVSKKQNTTAPARPNTTWEAAPSDLTSEKLARILEKRRSQMSKTNLSKANSYTSGTLSKRGTELTSQDQQELQAELVKSYAEEIIERKGQGNDLFADVAQGTVLMDHVENVDLLLQDRFSKNGVPPNQVGAGPRLGGVERKASKISTANLGANHLKKEGRSRSQDAKEWQEKYGHLPKDHPMHPSNLNSKFYPAEGQDWETNPDFTHPAQHLDPTGQNLKSGLGKVKKKKKSKKKASKLIRTNSGRTVMLSEEQTLTEISQNQC